MAKKKSKRLSIGARLKDIVIDTGQAEYERLRTRERKSREKLLVSKKRRRKNGETKTSKERVQWNSGKKLPRDRNRRRYYGLRVYIQFIGIAYLSKQQGKFTKHIRFANDAGNWKPKSINTIKKQWESDILPRLRRLYKDKISAYKFNVTFLTKDDVKKLKIKPD